ncbi:HepT-like ribonuclease domain-containing protein [Synechococcus sp. CCY 9618]|uniref:HepT-like ribonuclease domain-containing protein n=1 Tax=Synechococcus sp. CCY 9618 TaxID=2815602 RepID=UPI001C22D395
MGEASKRLSLDFRNHQSDVPWRAVAGMRDLLIHAYDRVDLEPVWEAYRQFPWLREEIDWMLQVGRE